MHRDLGARARMREKQNMMNTSARQPASRSPRRTSTSLTRLLCTLFGIGLVATIGAGLARNVPQLLDNFTAFDWQAALFKEAGRLVPSAASKTAAAAGPQNTFAAHEPRTATPIASSSLMREMPASGPPEVKAFETAMPRAPTVQPVGRGIVFEIGDKLKIAFYEHIDLQDDKWVKARPGRPSLQQRVELTGEYTVQVDGSISLPLFGIIPAAGRSAAELQSSLEAMFSELTGRRGFVTAVVLEHQPIYVLGPVKSPGSYRYAAGMTVFHAVALAGGLDRATLGTWQEIEGVRAAQKQQGSIDHLIRLLARDAVLKAERDGTAPKAPNRLVELAGEARAKNALNLEIDRRDISVMSNRARESTLSVEIENAKQEIATLSNRVPTLDANLQLRDERLNRMRLLASRNVVANVVVDQAQGDVLSVQERRQEAFGSIALARQRLSLAEQEKIRHQTQVKSELEQAIERVEQEIGDVERDLASSESELKLINAGGSLRPIVPSEDTIAYEIVRHTSAGTIVLNSSGTTSLQPGDLVRLRTVREYGKETPSGLSRARAGKAD